MRKLNKLAAAIAVALSAGVMAPQAHAIISAHYDQEGDAMLFPVFYGVLDNYYAIHNNSNLWVQGHLRFRGAAWSGELLDMDIILSPGDVFTFRVTDLDGDGVGELDQTTDPGNFVYTGLTTDEGYMEFKDSLFPNLVTGDVALDPSLYDNITDTATADQMAFGYIEFIGEAVLVGCDVPPTEGCDLDNDGNNQNDWPLTAWDWDAADPDNDNVQDDLTGVGNWLSGQWWISLPGGTTSGMSGAALMFRDFRTDDVGTVAAPVMRRIENYPNPEVILHVDDPTVNDDAYVYRFPDSDRYEQYVSFNNTWGPTLADGDDYNLGAGSVLTYTVLDAAGTAPTGNSGNVKQTMPTVGNVAVQNAYLAGGAGGGQDYWDDALTGITIYNPVNSVAEVDLALNKNAQQFSSHFFDGGSNNSSGTPPLMTFYFAHFPTKFYRAEFVSKTVPPSLGSVLANLRDLQHLINTAVDTLLSSDLDKTYDVEVWNTDETFVCTQSAISSTSPAVVLEKTCQYTFDYELDLVAISDLKATQSQTTRSFTEGQLLLFPLESDLNSGDVSVFRRSYPGLLYAFDIELSSGIDLSHWLPMFRSEWVK